MYSNDGANVHLAISSLARMRGLVLMAGHRRPQERDLLSAGQIEGLGDAEALAVSLAVWGDDDGLQLPQAGFFREWQAAILQGREVHDLALILFVS